MTSAAWLVRRSFSDGGAGDALPASLGAAVANKGTSRLTVAIGGDGDFMFVPSALRTAAHYRIPPDRSQQPRLSTDYIEAMGARHGRRITRADIGTILKDLFVE